MLIYVLWSLYDDISCQLLNTIQQIHKIDVVSYLLLLIPLYLEPLNRCQLSWHFPLMGIVHTC